MYNKLHLILKSKMKVDEILLLLHDKKQVVRQAFYEEEFPRIEKFCKENNIFVNQSRFKVILSDEETGNFSNKGLRIPENDKRPATHLYYFSKCEEKAYLANYYELMSNQKDLGLLLGYPSCCVEFFLNNFSKDNVNPEVKVEGSDDKDSTLLNLNKRWQDAVLVSHFPCSNECQESILQAKKNFQFLYENYPERAGELKRVLELK